MTTDETLMVEMLGRLLMMQRVTNPSRDTVDALGVQMFCIVARNNVHRAQDMIVSKIRSKNITESIRAIELLEECMSKCGGEFQDEVSKFRFLNDLIRLVSKKYQGPETAMPIKQRIMECLLLWTTEFPHRSKIREAYENLNKEGAVEHGNMPTVILKKESTLGIDEEVLSKLIKSGDPENFKRANLLIQYRVNQEARRTELRVQQKSELQEVQNTVGLLNQMLDTYETDNKNNKDKEMKEGGESLNLIRELYMATKRHKSIVQRLLEMIEQTEEDLMADILETNDLLMAVMKRYKSVVVHVEDTNANGNTHPNEGASSNTNLLAELLGDGSSILKSTSMPTPCTDSLPKQSAVTSLMLEELQDIFGGLSESEEKTTLEKNAVTDELHLSFDLLEPIHISDIQKVKEIPKAEQKSETKEFQKRSFRHMPEIDDLSAELFEKSLISTQRMGGSFKKEPAKVTLNDLVNETVSPVKKNEKTNSLNSIDKTIEYLEKDEEKIVIRDNENSSVLDASKTKKSVSLEFKDKPDKIPNSICVEKNQLPFKHLSEINIDLDEVTPMSKECILMDDDDINIKLNFTENRPSRHVSVIVISVLNKSAMPIRDFQFEASVKKPSKIRLLPPTDTQMLPYKPFRPPTPINQIMLLLNPTGNSTDITCIVGYKLGDDPDPIKESIVAKDIPYV